MREIEFERVREADLIIDAKYLSGRTGNLSDEVISKLMSVENQGGFRPRGRGEQKDFCVLPYDTRRIIHSLRHQSD